MNILKNPGATMVLVTLVIWAYVGAFNALYEPATWVFDYWAEKWSEGQ